MGLIDKFKSRFSARPAPPRPGAGADSAAAAVVQQARVRARRRLIGAAVLLVVGIIGFPLLFETQPRPIPVDIPIEIPSRDAAVPLMPASQRSVRPEPALQAPPVEAQVSAAASEAGVVETEPASAAVPQRKAAVKPAERPASPVAAVTVTASGPGAASAAQMPPVAPRLAAPAQALPKPPEISAAETKAVKLRSVDSKSVDAKAADAKAAASRPARPDGVNADEGRFVVQVGAFAEAESAREARGKVEALGLKTYTQVIESASGRRIRVRVGPYPTRADADKAAARIKAGGLQAAVLLL